MKPRKLKDPNPLVQVTILRERLRRSLQRERHKSRALNAMKAQLLLYVRDLKCAIDREPLKENQTRKVSSNDGKQKSELMAAWAQLLLYAKDLRVMVNHERKKGK